MARVFSHGPFRYTARSALTMIAIMLRTMLRRGFVGPLVPGWRWELESVVLFNRQQFKRALAMADIREGRKYFDSLEAAGDEDYDVARHAAPPGAPKGDWLTPRQRKSNATVLYLHGGGYEFYGAVSQRYATTLAGLLGTRMFVPDYRLTPEHRYPAQRDDGIASYRYLLEQGIDPKELVVMGDSAGGHLTLMMLAALREAGLAQPALAVGLCPWTDIGERGGSFYGNDRYDVISGSMAVHWGRSLIASTGFSREDASPLFQNYDGVAPIYLQGGGREVLIDMIRDFARVVAEQGCEMTLDVWPDMYHDFQAAGLWMAESAEAIARIGAAIAHYTSAGDDRPAFETCARTENHHRPGTSVP